MTKTRTLLAALALVLVGLFSFTGVAGAQEPPAPSPVPTPAPVPAPVPFPPPPPSPTAPPVIAQSGRRTNKVTPEVRLDGIIARVSGLHLGAGFTAAAGTYLRMGVIAGAGSSRNGLSGRLDGIARFHFDPFRQSRWAPYGGGGISGRFDNGEKARAYLLLLLGLDGPVYNGAIPSFELGLGGGARIGVIVRRATAERR